MKAKDLIPGKWYYCKEHYDRYKCFMFFKHEYSMDGPHPDYYLIKITNGQLGYTQYRWNMDYEELTPEKKLELL